MSWLLPLFIQAAIADFVKACLYARVAESEYAGDLKSPGRNTVWVQVPPFAPFPDVVKV